MANTPRLNLYLPTNADTANPNVIINPQYNIIDALGPGAYVHTGVLPGAPYDGQIAYNKTTGQLDIWTGGAWVFIGSTKKPLGMLGFSTVTDHTIFPGEDIFINSILLPPSASGRIYRVGYSLTIEQNNTFVNNPGDTKVVFRLSNRYNSITTSDWEIRADIADIHDKGFQHCPDNVSGEFNFVPFADTWSTLGLFIRRGLSNAAKVEINESGYDSFYVEDIGVQS